MTDFTVPDDPPLRREENLGSKAKFWFKRDGHEWLFKEARAGSGEAWAEIVAMHCAELLGLPHAHYELALWKDRRGVVSRSLTPDGTDLVFGNQLLAERDPGYPQNPASRFVREPRHTLAAVRAALAEGGVGLPADWAAPAQVPTAVDLFGGYLLLDAWIANADRHHLNWGVLVASGDTTRRLAPTFDHGSSLAAGLTDAHRQARLDAIDPRQSLAAFVRRVRVRSPFFRDSSEARALSPLEALDEWRRRHASTEHWRNCLRSARDEVLAVRLAQLPDAWMSATAKLFVPALLQANKQRILDLEAA